MNSSSQRVWLGQHVFSPQRVTLSQRVFLGGAAGALSLLLFHQTTLQVFFWLGLAQHSGFRLAIVPPFGVPLVVSSCFWAALLGAVYAAMVRRQDRHAWLTGLPLGCVALLLVWFVVLPLKHQPVAFGGQVLPVIRSTTASLMWGLGVGVILPFMLPRQLWCGKRRWADRQIAA